MAQWVHVLREKANARHCLAVERVVAPIIHPHTRYQTLTVELASSTTQQTQSGAVRAALATWQLYLPIKQSAASRWRHAEM
jgi:hypothetical protein